MLYMLDTNICVFLLKRRLALYFEKLEKIKKSHGIVAISSIVFSELQYGVANSTFVQQNQENLLLFTSKIEVLPYTEKCAYFYGELRKKLKSAGCLIGGNDLLLASHALSEDAMLITNNIKEFQRVPDLKVKSWLVAAGENNP
jgi:tRNA(fMet)-specific endonuclease VapC